MSEDMDYSDYYLENEIKETVKLYESVNEVLDSTYEGDIDELLYYRESLLHLLEQTDEMVEFDIKDTLKRGVLAEIMMEKLANRWLKLYHIKGKVVCNSLLNYNSQGKTSQIDIALVTDKCIFIIECKSLYGELTITSDFGFKSEFLDSPIMPFRQNETHIKVLKEELAEIGITALPPIYNVVFIFSQGKIVNYKQHLNPLCKLLVPKGSLTELSLMYDNIEETYSPDIMEAIIDLLINRIPTVEKSVKHIKELHSNG